MKTLVFDRDQVIFKQGSFGTCMYDIVSGKVGIFKDYGTEKQALIAELDSDQLFGEMGMIGVFARTADAVALEDGTTVAEITEEELSDYFKDKPEKLLRIMKLLSQRLRETTQKYIDACRTVYENEERNGQDDERSAWLAEHIAIYSESYFDSMLM